MNQKDVKKPEEKKKKKLILLIFLVLLIAGGFGAWGYYHKAPDQIVSGFPSTEGTKKMSDKDMKTYANKKVNASQVTLNVYPQISVDSDGIHGNMWVHNVPTNKIGQQVTLYDENNKEISKTGLIKPGYQVDTIKLKQRLSKGKHKGRMRITFYDLEKEKVVGKTSIDVSIEVN